MAGLVLGIESATALGGVALVSGDGRVLGEYALRGRESHAERIAPAVGELLEALGATPADLGAVAVSCGPGSFTGLRTGVAAAKGLAFSRGIPLYGVPTLEALAANAPPGSGSVCAVLGARRGELYRALFAAGAAGTVRRTPDQLVPEQELAADLPAGCLLLGEFAPVAGCAAPHLRRGPEHLNHPRAAVIALAGLAALRSGRPSELASLAPVYLRPAGDTVAGERGGGGLSCNDKGFRGGTR